MLNGRRAVAHAFLERTLASGPLPALQVEAAARAVGISERTLRRARKDIDVHAFKAAFGGAWLWMLSPKEAKGPKAATADLPSNGTNGHGRPTTQVGLTTLWHHPAALAAVEGYWRGVSPDLPVCLMWTFARDAEQRYPEDLPEQACWCIEQAIKEAFGEAGAIENGASERGA